MDIYFGSIADDHYSGTPLTLIDVGARGGLQPNWKRARRHLRLVGFEPDPVEYSRLAAKAAGTRDVYINAAVAGEAGDLTLNVGREGGTSSIHKPNLAFLRRFPKPERYEIAREVRVSADALDQLLAGHDVRDPDFIKIDAQGAELSILQGAQHALAESVFGAEIEILFAPLYDGQPSFGSIDDLMRAHGFQLFDLRPSYWKRAAGARFGGPKGQLAFADALYLRTETAFSAQLAQLGDSTTRASKLLRALSICLLYGYLDYAIELFDEHQAHLPDAVRQSVDATLRSEIPFSARLPHFRGRGWLSHALYRMHRALFPTAGGWASGGRSIGNVD